MCIWGFIVRELPGLICLMKAFISGTIRKSGRSLCHLLLAKKCMCILDRCHSKWKNTPFVTPAGFSPCDSGPLLSLSGPFPHPLAHFPTLTGCVPEIIRGSASPLLNELII